MKIPALFPVIFLSIVLSCSSGTKEKTNTTDILEQISIIADTQPDSAFAAIREIRRKDLKDRKSIARYSLVYSKVLDKNYIDAKSDSLIAPALEYYGRKRPCKEKSETYYYAARIEENIGNYSGSMEMLHMAEESLPKETSELNGLIYSAKARIYHHSVEYESAALNYRKAAQAYGVLNNQNRHWTNKLREADCLIKCGLLEETYKIITSIEGVLDDLPETILNRYYQIKITYLKKAGSDETDYIVRDYISSIRNKQIIDWIMIAQIMVSKGDADSALEALEMHRRYNPANAVYHYYMGKACEMKEDWSSATNAYKEYIKSHSSIGADILSQDTKFVEEREIRQKMYEKEKGRRIILSLATAVALLILSLASVCIANSSKQLKIEYLEKENLQSQLDGLMLEREELASLDNRNQEGRMIISERLRIIDQFVMSDAFNDSIFETKASETLKTIISDRAEFVRQNRLIFNQSASRFINHLTEKGLTDIEIDHCCLYAIGMNGKMVTTFTNAKRHYHIGSDVRKKLGLSTHDTNISIYIRNLYHQMQG